MEFRLKTKPNPQLTRYSGEDLDIARAFSKKVLKEFGSFVKAIVLFGSAARKGKGPHDVDVMVVVNDMTITLSSEVVETYRVIMEKIVPETSKRLHLTTLKLTNFWDMVRTGDPIGINILRDGVALYDTGFFDPLQALLFQGRIRPTYESIWSYYSRAPNTLYNSRWHILQASLDLYWAVIDAAHAALMKVGEIPPSPAHVADMIDEALVKKKIVASKYATIMNRFFNLSKKIVRREIKDVTGTEYERYYKDAKEFVDVMKKVVERK